MSYRELAGLCDGLTSLYSVNDFTDAGNRKRRRCVKAAEKEEERTSDGTSGRVLQNASKVPKNPRHGHDRSLRRNIKGGAANTRERKRHSQETDPTPEDTAKSAWKSSKRPCHGSVEASSVEEVFVDTSKANADYAASTTSKEASDITTHNASPVHVQQQQQLPSPPASTKAVALAWTAQIQDSPTKKVITVTSQNDTVSSVTDIDDLMDISGHPPDPNNPLALGSQSTSTSPFAVSPFNFNSFGEHSESPFRSLKPLPGPSSEPHTLGTPERPLEYLRSESPPPQRESLIVKLPIQCRLEGSPSGRFVLVRSAKANAVGEARSSAPSDSSNASDTTGDISEPPDSDDGCVPKRPLQKKPTATSSRKRKPASKPKRVSKEELPAVIPEEDIRRELDESLDPAVVNTSFKLYEAAHNARSTPKERKPPSVAQPQVWAADRQALCETLPYFNAHNGGCAMKDGSIFGFMFDKGANDRDLTRTNVIIARAGGGMETVDGVSQLRGNQDVGNQVLAFQQAIDQYTPIPIILGGNNPTVESRLVHSYNVTDLWKPTDIWHEKEAKTGHTMIRYRFEIFDEEKLAWWDARDTHNDLTLGSCGPVHVECCKSCGQASKQVYINGWMCLQSPYCKAYWTFKDGSVPSQSHLRYDARFLLQKSAWPFAKPNIQLIPPLLTSAKVLGVNYSKQASKGVVCRDCGRCNQRLDFMKWLCESCGWEYKLPEEVIPIDMLVPSNMAFTDSYDPCRDMIHPAIQRLKPIFLHGYRISVYVIPDIDGFVAHAVPNKSVIELPGGPNECFECLQTTDIGLKRRAMPQKGGGEHRMSSFTRNYGQYYKFVADTEDSAPIQAAPMPVRQSAKRMNWLANLIKDQVSQQLDTNIDHRQFNEILALAYLEGKSIGFHDDGEKYVGPTIATESFGSNGNMIIRMKEKYQKGYSGRDLLTDDTVGGELFKPIPLCHFYKRRLEVYENELVKLEGDVLKERKEKLVQEIKRLQKLKGNKKGKGARGEQEGEPDAEADEEVKHFRSAKGPIDMKLRHGDITIMHGAGIQRYYEHAVIHQDSLRFALTCRSMEPNPSLGDPPYEITEDDIEWEGWRVPT